MSPASYLTAPPRDAASIVAPSVRKTVVTMPGMALLTWISLLFLVVAVVGSIAYAATRALGAWRTFRRFSRTTSAAIGGVLETAAEAEGHALAFTEGTEKLSAALARLEQSRARLAVIQAAASQARTSLSSLRGAVPRK
ncbi:MAG: hypothetical protein QOH16_3599 [Gaiellaceae bacterium]|jgi:hypothetical protein|nr:hypothetical protein [Gaiellaceae bacterium]